MLSAKRITKEYPTPNGKLPVLCDVELEVKPGESAAVIGPSGSGKSTLLYVLGALDAPTSGTVLLNGTNPYTLNDTELAKFRNRSVGFIFQDHCLLPQLTVLENVLTPTLVARDRNGVEERAQELLQRVGLEGRAHHRPGELSGGEKQRCAIARALVMKPALLLCDEPTGNLDRDTAEKVADLLFELQAAEQTILVLVTHSTGLAQRAGVRFEMRGQHLEPRP
jgi:lipoprotein-releasing system ATP-binding protein